MTTAISHAADRIGVLLVDPYNDFLSEAGKIWPMVKKIAEEEQLLDHLRQIVAAARCKNSALHRAVPSLGTG